MSFRSIHNTISMRMGTMPGAMMCGTTCVALKKNIYPKAKFGMVPRFN